MYSDEEKSNIITVSLLFSVKPSKTTNFIRRDIDLRSHYFSHYIFGWLLKSKVLKILWILNTKSTVTQKIKLQKIIKLIYNLFQKIARYFRPKIPPPGWKMWVGSAYRWPAKGQNFELKIDHKSNIIISKKLIIIFH